MNTAFSKPLRAAQRCLVALGMACLSACGTMNHAPDTATPVATRPYSETIDIAGRFSAQFEQNGKPQSWSGNFNWEQTPEQTMVTLLSPLGQTVATISVSAAGATLVQADHAPKSAPNVDALVQDTLGWPLPISNLRNWMQARVIDSDRHPLVATPQTTQTIDTADGWRLQYLSWQDSDTSAQNAQQLQQVPKRIDMERDTSYAGRVQMRLVISSWQPH